MNPANSPTKLSVLDRYSPSSEEHKALMDRTRTDLMLIVSDKNFSGNKKVSMEIGESLIEAIAENRIVTLRYRDDETSAEDERTALPYALYRMMTIPGDTKWSGDQKPVGTTNRIIHPHLKLDAYQSKGFSQSGESGFKTFDIDCITSLRVDWVLDPESYQDFLDRMVLDNVLDARYIIQWQELRLRHRREELHRIMNSKVAAHAP